MEEQQPTFKRNCAIAVLLCSTGLIGDFVRWIVLLAFHNGMAPYYIQTSRLRKAIWMSIGWDAVCVTASMTATHQNRVLKLFPVLDKWSRMQFVVATTSRLFMWIPMIQGNPVASKHLLQFVFLVQVAYYFGLIVSWKPLVQTYLRGLRYQMLESAPPPTLPPPSSPSSTTQLTHSPPSISIPQNPLFNSYPIPTIVAHPNELPNVMRTLSKEKLRANSPSPSPPSMSPPSPTEKTHLIGSEFQSGTASLIESNPTIGAFVTPRSQVSSVMSSVPDLDLEKS